MQRARFDGLRTVRVEHESRNGRAELCRGPDGARRIRLCIQAPACQREVLRALDESIPVRLEGDALELLLPWQEGMPLRQWLYEERPSLGRRRDACLALLGQLVELRGKLPPGLTALALRTENVTVEGDSAALRYLPALKGWEPDGDEGEAVRAAAGVIRGVLTAGLEKPPWGRLPEELRLLCRRQEEGDYGSWGQLQRDVAALPDELPRIKPVWAARLRWLQSRLSRHEDRLLGLLAALLLAAALLSLGSAYLRWRGGEAVWQGMVQVGGQDLRRGEAET